MRRHVIDDAVKISKRPSRSLVVESDKKPATQQNRHARRAITRFNTLRLRQLHREGFEIVVVGEQQIQVPKALVPQLLQENPGARVFGA